MNVRFLKNSLLCILVAHLNLLPMGCTRKEEKAKLPNVVIILADDLGYGDLGSYGSDKNKTPRLDKMASEGIKFTDFYTTAPVCSPSRASLMTGCYPQRVGLGTGDRQPVLLPGDSVGINSDEKTIAEVLKEQGYATTCIGKWHLGDQPEFSPTRHGFDSYFGIPYSNDMQPGKTPLPLMKNEEVIEWDPDQSTLTKRYTEQAIQFIKQNKATPFFLYLPHMYVHTPLHATKEFLDKSDNGVYGAEVETIDWSTGEIMDTLKTLGIDENTIVIFTSDNGAIRRDGGSNLPLRGVKTTTWEGGIRVPFIARWPGKIPAGKVCTELATIMDILPTIAYLADGNLPKERVIDGKNIWPLLSAEKKAVSPYEAFFYYYGNSLNAVRLGKWKLHLKKQELYDLEKDIGESVNINREYPDIVSRLNALAEKCRQELGDEKIVGKNIRLPGRVQNPITLYERFRMEKINKNEEKMTSLISQDNNKNGREEKKMNEKSLDAYTYKEKAEYLYDKIVELYSKKELSLFTDQYPGVDNVKRNGVPFLWSFSTMFSAVNAMSIISGSQEQYLESLDYMINGLELYWSERNGIRGYESFPPKFKGGNRFYDDNAWIGIDLLDAYKLTNDSKYLVRAKEVFDFIMSGWSDELGGGIYWDEKNKNSKNTCSNGPTAVMALKLYEATKEKSYLDQGLKIYQWTKEKLQSPNGVYWDHIKTTGECNQRFFTYNTGTMLHSAALLYSVTGEEEYLKEAQRLAKASLDYFAPIRVDGRRFFPAKGPWFHAVLFRGYEALYQLDQNPLYIDTMIENIDHAWLYARDSYGLIRPDWSGMSKDSDTPRDLKEEACLVELYARAALLKQ